MIRLGEWEFGFAFWPAQQADLRMYLWFYEWNLFDAVTKGEHTAGYWIPQKSLSPDFQHGTLANAGMKLEVTAVEDGALLSLTVQNESGHDWPELATIIPCFNPGAPEYEHAPSSASLLDEEHQRTWFASVQGLERLTDRSIHFNQALRPAVNALSHEGRFVFSDKWPTSPVDAAAGIMLRESRDGGWVVGIAWEDYLSAQGHNPWRCLHLGVRVGPLERGATRQLRGRLYLSQSSKETCYELFRQEFA